jgi:hypothetical protein
MRDLFWKLDIFGQNVIAPQEKLKSVWIYIKEFKKALRCGVMTHKPLLIFHLQLSCLIIDLNYIYITLFWVIF